eukprot:TRINITY_DN3583_c0_g1_i9.p1 TRINITY_DN3583_c0_g1~~TRINITY_DN3583_c0_g1_i9.p1  ORF type:complete len:171 (-),score=74.48 TRINITY_DN3583_c0_g1_i9:169-681(-)
MSTFTQEAIELNKRKHKRRAILALKKKKMFEGEFNKISGMRLMLEQQKIQLEASVSEGDIFNALKAGNVVIAQLSQKADVEDFENLKAEIEERRDDAREVEEFFTNAALEDEDEYLEELKKLESEDAMEDAQWGNVPNDPLPSTGSSVKEGPDKMSQVEDSKLLESLMGV